MTEQCAANLPANWDFGSLADEAARQSKYVTHLNNLIATAQGNPPPEWQTPATTAPATAYPHAQTPSQPYQTQAPTTKIAPFSPPVTGTGTTGESRRTQQKKAPAPAKKTMNEYVRPGDTVDVSGAATRTSSPNGSSAPRRTNTGETSPNGQQGSGYGAGAMRAGDFVPDRYREAVRKQEEVRKIPQVQYYEFKGL